MPVDLQELIHASVTGLSQAAASMILRAFWLLRWIADRPEPPKHPRR
ncbi:hypothetical protein [Streptosporangium canum]